jgi:predicted benzoate:H+ symporter BenE
MGYDDLEEVDTTSNLRDEGTISVFRGCVKRVKTLWRDLTWREASGSLGDLGTFLPLLVGLTVESGLDVGTTLVVTGVYNLITAMVFDVPMPVQPMKTIAAVALADPSITVPQIVAAGMFVSLVVFFLGATGLIDTFNRVVPRAVVHGMQIGLGILLCVKAFTLAVFEDSRAKNVRPFLGADGLLLGACALALTAFESFGRFGRERKSDDAIDANAVERRDDARGDIETTSNVETTTTRTNGEERTKTSFTLRLPPVALLLVVVGLLLSATRPGSLDTLRLGPSQPSLLRFSRKDLVDGVVKAGLPQLPLTTLNSVVAVCALSGQLFPDRPATPKMVATSVGAMNLAGAAIGVMPCCHGAGGLAAHYHFGARRGAATAFLGVCKLVSGLVFGGSLLTLLEEFPKTVLGVMLGAASVELIRAAVRAFSGGRTSETTRGAGTGEPDDPGAGDGRETTDTAPSDEATFAVGYPSDGAARLEDRAPKPPPALWRDPEAYALLATAVATAASGNTGIGVGIGGAVAMATRSVSVWERTSGCFGTRARSTRGDPRRRPADASATRSPQASSVAENALWKHPTNPMHE